MTTMEDLRPGKIAHMLKGLRQQTTLSILQRPPTDDESLRDPRNIYTGWYHDYRECVVTVLEERGMLTPQQSAGLKNKGVGFWRIVSSFVEKNAHEARQSFPQWLAAQTEREDEVGQLARTADEGRPQSSVFLEWSDYFRESQPSFYEAWSEWKAAKEGAC